MIDDREIDLTEHNDFERSFNGVADVSFITFASRSFWDSISENLKVRLYGDIPWSVYLTKKTYPYDGLLALGNKDQRKDAIESYCWGTKDSITCDCCGAQYRHIPWDGNSGLCKKCQLEMKRNKSLIPWI